MGTEEIFYDIEGVPDTFYEKGRENVVLAGDVHVMDEKPAERLAYAREVAWDINEALEKYNSDTVVFNGDTGSPDHIGTILDELKASQAIFIEGDEDRKEDEEIDYTGWANLLDKSHSNHFDTEVDYTLEGEHIRLDEVMDLPGSYPVHVQHFPVRCDDSEGELGFEASWMANPLLYRVEKYDISRSIDSVPQAAFHSHTHGYNSRAVGVTGLTSLGAYGENYITSEKLPESSLQAVSFGPKDFEVVHEDRKSNEIVETQKFREEKSGFELVKSRGEPASLKPHQRFEIDLLPSTYLEEINKAYSNVSIDIKQ